jgi:hypothetical protein
VSNGAEQSGNLRREVVKYIADKLHIEEAVLGDDLELGEYLKQHGDENIYHEDYAFFWREFIRDFGVYDEMLDFDVYSHNKRLGPIRRWIARPLFNLGIIGYGGQLSEILVGDLVVSAKHRIVSPNIKRNIVEYWPWGSRMIQ